MTRVSVLLWVAACGGATASPAATPANATVLARLAVGCDVGVVTQGGAVYVFGRDQASVVRDGEVVARAAAPTQAGKPVAWEAAAAIAAPDGKRWAVGLAGGELWRVTPAGELEPVGDRLGLAGERVLAIDGSGGTFAIGLGDGFAVSRDGHHLMQFRGPATPHVAAAHDRIALARGTTVELLDLAAGTKVSYGTTATVDALAFLDAATEQPQLVVNAAGTVYVANQGTLRKLALPAAPRQLAASGARLWMLGDGALYSVAGPPVRVATPVDHAAHIYSTSAGDIWLGSARELQRYSLDPDIRASWQAAVAPIFDRTCAKCHRPGGSAEIDLSTPAAWLEQVDSIRHELGAREMPPPDAEVKLADADRLALERWLAR